MTNVPKLLQSLLIYSVCLPLALILGYTVAMPTDLTTFGIVGLVMVMLCLPLFLRLHHPLLVFFWNASMLVFFLPGKPKFFFLALALSFGISITHRALSQRPRFISVPSLSWPLVALAVVVLVTAELRGGIGLKSMGGSVYGGQKYVFLLAGVVGYFALVAQRIPPNRAHLYVGLFFLSGLTSLVGDLFTFTPDWGRYLFLVFPPNPMSAAVGANQIARWSGLGTAASIVPPFLLACYGIRGIFLERKWWRLLLFLLSCAAALLGGFRGVLLGLILTFGLLFFFERLYRTKLLPLFLLGALLVGPVSLMFVRDLPLPVQRTLAFLPIDVDPVASADAQHSSEWRFKMWQALLPQIPEYLLLGKGYAFSVRDAEFSQMEQMGTVKAFSEDQQGLALASEYHSGPLSVVIPFGIWGVIAVLWLWAAGCRVLYRNYRFSSPDLKKVNTFLLVSFIVKIFAFLFVFGALNLDLLGFTGLLGLSVSLNGSVRQPEAEPVPEAAPAKIPSRLSLRRPSPALSRVEG